MARMMSHAGRLAVRLLPALARLIVAASLLSLLVGCDSPQPQAQSPHAPSATSAATRCQSTPTTLPAGWGWYRDTRYPFQIAYPTAWRAGSFEYTGGSDYTLAHVVDFFPPGSTGQASAVGRQRADIVNRIITIEVDLNPTPQLDPSTNPHFHADSPRVCLSGIPVTVYTLDNTSDGKGIEQSAVITFGTQTYRYEFTLVSPTATNEQDRLIFAQMLITCVVSTP